MSFVLLADVRALVACRQTDPQLQTILDREEAWLMDRIGVLTGPRTQTFYLPAEREQIYIEPSGYALDRPRLPYPYNRTCTPASRHLVRNAACLRATSRSTKPCAAMACCAAVSE